MKLQILSALTLALMIGCNEVEDRLAWSPDGKQAALRVEDRLYLMDANGKLSDVIASNVTGAAWLPDGRGLVLTRSLTVLRWADAEELLPAEEISAVQSLAKGLLALGVRGLDQFELKRPELASAAILYLGDTQSNALHEAVQKDTNPAKLEADLSNMRTTQVAEVSVFLLAGKEPRVIQRSLTVLSQALPSPAARLVAFQADGKLAVAPLDGSTNRVTVTEKLLGAYGWTADGKAVVYANRLSDKDNTEITIAGITHRVVVGPNGELMAGQSLPLGMNASTFTPRVKCLPDGRALFSGQPMQLPSPALVQPPSRFYLIDPAQGTNAAPVAIPSEAGSLPQDLAAFAPSPDGRTIAIVERGSDAVAVLDVKSGAVEVISPKRGWNSKVLPAWRGPDELYFAALPAASTNRPELFRWRRGGAPVAISTNWPEAIVNTLLEKPRQKSGPS
jgi:hypothetical protein